MLSAGTTKRVNFIAPLLNIAQNEAYKAAVQIQEALRPFLGLKVQSADKSFISKVEKAIPSFPYQSNQDHAIQIQLSRTDFYVIVKAVVTAPKEDGSTMYISEDYLAANLYEKGLAALPELSPRHYVKEEAVIKAIIDLEAAKAAVREAWQAIPHEICKECGLNRD